MNVVLFCLFWIIVGTFFTRKFINPQASQIAKGSVILLWPGIVLAAIAIVSVVLFVHFVGWLA